VLGHRGAERCLDWENQAQEAYTHRGRSKTKPRLGDDRLRGFSDFVERVPSFKEAKHQNNTTRDWGVKSQAWCQGIAVVAEPT
jgi:hypothetical protein